MFGREFVAAMRRRKLLSSTASVALIGAAPAAGKLDVNRRSDNVELAEFIREHIEAHGEITNVEPIYTREVESCSYAVVVVEYSDGYSHRVYYKCCGDYMKVYAKGREFIITDIDQMQQTLTSSSRVSTASTSDGDNQLTPNPGAGDSFVGTTVTPGYDTTINSATGGWSDRTINKQITKSNTGMFEDYWIAGATVEGTLGSWMTAEQKMFHRFKVDEEPKDANNVDLQYRAPYEYDARYSALGSAEAEGLIYMYVYGEPEEQVVVSQTLHSHDAAAAESSKKGSSGISIRTFTPTPGGVYRVGVYVGASAKAVGWAIVGANLGANGCDHPESGCRFGVDLDNIELNWQ